METTTLYGGFGVMLIGQEIPGIVPVEVWLSTKTVIPSPASRDPSNVMNILSMTLLVLEGFYITMNIPTPMVGAFLVQK